MTSSWFFLSTLNYDARSTTHQKQDIAERNLTRWSRYRPSFTEPKGSLPYSQDPNVGSHPEPYKLHIRQRHFFDTIYGILLYTCRPSTLSFLEAPPPNLRIHYYFYYY